MKMKKMFRIECFTTETKLAQVLTAIDGLVYNMAVNVARNATVESDTMVENGEGDGSKSTAVVTSILKMRAHGGLYSIDRATIIKQAGQLGIPVSAVTYGIKKLMEAGMMTRKVRGTYSINQGVLDG